MSESPKDAEFPLLPNKWAKESEVNTVQRPVCRCMEVPFDGRWRHELMLHAEKQDTTCRGWNRLLELIDQAAADGREEFSPSREMHPNEWSQIVTLPPTIAKLKAVKHFILYGSSLVRIPPEIGEMASLELFSPYTSYRLHWFPYEITKCAKLIDSTVSTRAIYGNFKHRPPFPKLPQLLPDCIPQKCSICAGPFQGPQPRQAWISLRVATDVLPLLVHACSEECLSRLPTPAEEYYPKPHNGGLELDQPLVGGSISARNIRSLLKNGGYQDQTGPLPREKAIQFALTDAAENNHLQLIQELVAEGAELTADPLIAASEHFHLSVVDYLLSQGVDANERQADTGETALMYAAAAGFVDGVRCLLANGADPAICDNDGENALVWGKEGSKEDNHADGLSDEAREAFATVIELIESRLRQDDSE